MIMRKTFHPTDLEEIKATKYLYIRSGEHRFIPIWVVVINSRVVVRSWNDKPNGWYRAFVANPLGEIRLGEREVRIRTVPLRNKSLIDGVQPAYGRKYTTTANAKYVAGFATERRKRATLELLPA